MREGGAEEKDVLTWIPRGPHDPLRPPKTLKDFQRSWFEELLWAMFDYAPMQGYLPATSDLFSLAGVHRKDFWDANKSELMAVLEVVQVAGRGEFVTYPPLLRVIAEQRKRLRMRKSRSPDKENVGSSLSLSFDFDSEVQNQKPEVSTVRAKPPSSAKLKERERKERAANLEQAKKQAARRGLTLEQFMGRKIG